MHLNANEAEVINEWWQAIIILTNRNNHGLMNYWNNNH